MSNTEDTNLTPPYFHIRRIGEQVRVSGVPCCTLGHKLQSKHLDKSDGIFAEWTWNGKNLKIHNDRYGFYPLYYFATKDEIAISPSLPKLVAIGAPTDLNHAGLAVFLRLGFFLGEDTPFLAIHAVPAGATLEWGQGELRVSSARPDIRPLGLTRRAAIDAYISLFREAIRRRIPPDENFGVLLSGGRDSRHVLLELISSGFRPKFTLTVATSPYSISNCTNNDMEIARNLSEAVKIRHIVLNQTVRSFDAELLKNFVTNFCSDEHAWLLPAAEYLTGKNYTLYDGLGGDVLSAGLYLNENRLALFEGGEFYKLADELLGCERLHSLLKASVRQNFRRELALDRVVSELMKFMAAPNPIGAFMFWNRTRREVALAPYSMLSVAPLVFSPYLDHAVYDLLAGLPASMMVGHTFHSDAIRKAYPRYAHIPYSVCFERQDDHSNFHRDFTIDVLRYILASLSLSPIKACYLLPRLVRCLFDRKYSSSIMNLGPLAAYLIQLRLLEVNKWGYLSPLRHGRFELSKLWLSQSKMATSHETMQVGLID